MRTKTSKNNTILILIAEDDPEDRLLAKEAIDENGLVSRVEFVENGVQLMDYLFNRPPYTDKEKFPTPGLVILDLNMPKKDGREALKEIKSSKLLKSLPVVVLSTSKADEDIMQTYDLGVNSFITKPVTFKALVEIMDTLCHYWFEIVELPANHD
ncbi:MULTISPECIES: response regulator [unclassified Imperialibacter]|jgi:CheY-like chemotaxis protein|uniref:response regulator n=1 Tax=unclassified Imperialibacter TaxID=2629706 RepID=UPI001258BF2E|nr:MULTISPECIES: response regulator [unclassified Imperialibacter]CAD5268946.1 Response regulator receiver domain-containing protein [Imperialibacter sp. 89]CAD5297238.1 Response regulator receiver domain-containing protein [Imperialibacter sp. 75]VVT34064.1 Two-component system response regulator [Imperialibacter sp. EC-SDR9]